MTIAPGTRFGIYEVSGSIGAGGMGEVYRARDTRLGRDVALKTLPPAFAADADRMARFEREAQVLASLNHPHIAAIYGLEEERGVRALIMELVPGATLADQLSGGALVPDDALRIARQIADALEYAHEKGIVHRDLKPANVKITPEGVVKVLDFGLAKAAEEPSDQTDVNSPTLTMRATQAGFIMGTAGYMSPEQASGKPVDRRSDIWAFGVVLWEMLAGRRLFHGETISHTLADVLRADIDLNKLPSSVPPPIRALIGRCLDRDRQTRLRDIGEARVAIDRYLADPAAALVASSAPRAAPESKQAWMAWIMAAIGFTAAGIFAWMHFRTPEVDGYSVQFSVPPPPKVVLSPFDTPAISPDGRYIAFTGHQPPANNMLWIRSVDSLESRAIPGTEGAILPFWSPDSRNIGFSALGKTRKVALAGSPPVTLYDTFAFGGSWGGDGVILIGSNNGPIRQLSQGGGEPKPVLALDKARKETSQMWPQLLPDGKHFLFLSRSVVRPGVYMGTLGSGQVRNILDSDAAARFAPPGYLVFLRQETLMGQPFDLAKGQLAGSAFPIAEGVGRVSEFGGVLLSNSDRGDLVYRPSSSSDSRLTIYGRDGKKLGVAGPPGAYSQLALSPDGKRLAVERRDARAGSYDIWILEIASGVMSRLTFDPGNDRDPVWSPDSREIVFGSDRGGEIQLYRKTIGSAREELLYKSAEREIPEAWTKDGSILWGNYSGHKYFLLPLAGPREARQVFQSEFTMDEPNVSPDGKWVAYGSTESGRFEVYTARFPEFSDRRQISPEGGAQPHWTSDGRQIVYIAMTGYIMSADVTIKNGALESSPPRLLFETHIRTTGTVEQFAMSADGSRFYIPEPVEEAEKPMTVILNWPARLKK